MAVEKGFDVRRENNVYRKEMDPLWTGSVVLCCASNFERSVQGSHRLLISSCSDLSLGIAKQKKPNVLASHEVQRPNLHNANL